MNAEKSEQSTPRNYSLLLESDVNSTPFTFCLPNNFVVNLMRHLGYSLFLFPLAPSAASHHSCGVGASSVIAARIARANGNPCQHQCSGQARGVRSVEKQFSRPLRRGVWRGLCGARWDWARSWGARCGGGVHFGGVLLAPNRSALSRALGVGSCAGPSPGLRGALAGVCGGVLQARCSQSIIAYMWL